MFFGEDDSVKPIGVAGKFLGHFENGHAIGAFGAMVEPEEAMVQ